MATLGIQSLSKSQVSELAKKGASPDHAPFEFGLLPGDAEKYEITGDALKGQRGLFTRDQRAAVVGVDLAGRLFTRGSGGLAVRPRI